MRKLSEIKGSKILTRTEQRNVTGGTVAPPVKCCQPALNCCVDSPNICGAWRPSSACQYYYSSQSGCCI